MEAKGVRRLLIAFFALLNMLFFSLYLYESMSNDYIGADYVDAAVKNLTERGISVSSDKFVLHKPRYRAASIVTDGESGDGRQVSDSLISYTLGNVKTRSVELETPDGISITYYDSDEEYSHIQLAKTFYEKNSFYFEYSDNRYANKAQTPTTRYDEFDSNISYDDKRLLSGVVSCFGKTQVFGSRISGCAEYEDGTVYTLVQTLDDIEISGMYINVLVWNGEILSVKGSWIPVNTDKYYDCNISDGINAVFSLDLTEVTEIISEKCVYILKRADENKYYLIPVWEIVYVDADGNTVTEIIESDIVNKY